MKIAIIGAGIQGARHAAAWLKAGHQIVSCYDPDLDKALAFVKKFNCERTTVLDYAYNKADVISIASPDGAHGYQTHYALACGKHVFCEKPLCVTLGDLSYLR